MEESQGFGTEKTAQRSCSGFFVIQIYLPLNHLECAVIFAVKCLKSVRLLNNASKENKQNDTCRDVRFPFNGSYLLSL